MYTITHLQLKIRKPYEIQAMTERQAEVLQLLHQLPVAQPGRAFDTHWVVYTATVFT